MTTVSPRQRRFASFMADVLIYSTVLNLFVEYSSVIVIDSFTISILTAIVLKLLLDVILTAEHKVSDFFTRRQRPLSKLFRVLAVWFILFSSKFVILEVVDLVFGDHVELGGFILVAVLVIVMMVVRQLFVRIYQAIGTEVRGPERTGWISISRRQTRRNPERLGDLVVACFCPPGVRLARSPRPAGIRSQHDVESNEDGHRVRSGGPGCLGDLLRRLTAPNGTR